MSGEFTYRGSYQVGKRDGLGKHALKEKLGEWKRERRDLSLSINLIASSGAYCYLDGTRYLGDGKNNMPHGYGVQRCHDGSKKEGKWKRGVFIEPKINLFSFQSDLARKRARDAIQTAHDALSITAYARAK